MVEKKISISLSKEVFDRLENKRKKTKTNRSQLIEDSLKKDFEDKMSRSEKLSVFSIKFAIIAIIFSFCIESIDKLITNLSIPPSVFGIIYFIFAFILLVLVLRIKVPRD